MRPYSVTIIRSSGYITCYLLTRNSTIYKRQKRNRTHIFMPENSVRIHKNQILFPSLSFSRLLSFCCYFFVDVAHISFKLPKPLPVASRHNTLRCQCVYMLTLPYYMDASSTSIYSKRLWHVYLNCNL